MTVDMMAKAAQLFTLPDIYFKLREVLNDPDSSMEDVAKIVSCDPGLTARMLKLVNSPVMPTARTIETISRAVTLLGTNQIHDFALATVVAGRFNCSQSGHIDMTVFWRHSVYCALCAKALAVRCDVLDSERLFVAGLLRDIGHLVMWEMCPEDMDRARQLATDQQRPQWQIEREILGVDYTQVAESLMENWKLPDSLRVCAATQNKPSAAGPYALNASIVHIAAAMTEAGGAGASLECESLNVEPFAWQTCDVDAEQCLSIHESALPGIDEMLSLFLPRQALVA